MMLKGEQRGAVVVSTAKDVVLLRLRSGRRGKQRCVCAVLGGNSTFRCRREESRLHLCRMIYF